ncbi:hypothetical protein CPB83DRAFT_838066 [Crepidotus variabilis]|uniref:Uncharacterized protein n=1 Tax=Crepidotus variabilis TaxID=179855 RepID=A0A9P6JMF4_9AGAR|nr:hypothetical protein CPB83DRAFT_838066 [Crepidotus variabilis]
MATSTPLDPTRPQFPPSRKWAVWHNDAGLLVSQFNRSVPLEIKEPFEDDYSEPRLLTDATMWLAFFPRRGFAYGSIFQPLDLSNDELRALIEPCPRGFALRRDTALYWVALEDILVGFYQTLLERHEHYLSFPSISKPRVPTSYGFFHTHANFGLAFRCARRGRDAFKELVAISSFSLSLWLTSAYKDDALDKAFQQLAKRQFRPFTDSILEQLRSSAVCNLEPGFRPGCFLDAYSSKWGQGLDRFGRAGVPVWLLWGSEKQWTRKCADSYARQHLFPPSNEIEEAKLTKLHYTSVVLPHSRTYQAHPEAVERHHPQDEPQSPHNQDFDFPDIDDLQQEPLHATKEIGEQSVTVEVGSGQSAGETWASFRHRCERREKAARSILTQQEKISIEARSEVAKTQLVKDAKVYTWEQDLGNPGYFVRTRIHDSQRAAEVWLKATSSGRVYWPFLHEFDILNSEATLSDPSTTSSDDEAFDKAELFNFVADAASGLENLDPAQILLDHIRDCAPTLLPADTFLFSSPSLRDYMSQRHGYEVSVTGISYDQLHNRGNPHSLNPKQGQKLVDRILFRSTYVESNFEDYDTAFVDFNNTAVAVSTSSSHNSLSPPWDIAPPSQIKIEDLPLKIMVVHLSETISPSQFATWQEKENRLYILKPKDEKLDQSKWFVATTDPTTVLFVCRKGWSTMLEVARGLLDHGVPFRTVEPQKKRKRTSVAPSLQDVIPSRGKDFDPDEDDYIAYLSYRKLLLSTALGRAVRLRGGIAGRIAMEYVKEQEVLAGPRCGDEVVGYDDDGYSYMDDGVSENFLNAICGLYRIRLRPDVLARGSFWPTQSAWMNSGYGVDHWSPDAEEFFKRRAANFEAKQYNVLPHGAWRLKIKKYRGPLLSILKGSGKLATSFVETLLQYKVDEFKRNGTVQPMKQNIETIHLDKQKKMIDR